jgi:hypothetical protein
LSYTYANYTKDATRKDQLFDVTTGLQTYLGQYVTLTPSYAINYLMSKNTYYQYFSTGPSIYFSYYPFNSLSFYFSGSYLYTSYGKRTFSLYSLAGKLITTSEKQTLMTTDVGIIYNIMKNVPLQVSYSTTKNSSNYSYRDYKLATISGSISINL